MLMLMFIFILSLSLESFEANGELLYEGTYLSNFQDKLWT